MKTTFKIYIPKPLDSQTVEIVTDRYNHALYMFAEYFKDRHPSLLFELLDDLTMRNFKTKIDVLAHELKILAKADYVVFMDGWDTSRRCRFIWNVATEYKMRCYYI